MRNNQDRIIGSQGQSHMQDSEALTADKAVFNYIIPTQLIDLPSKGKFYPESHPLHNCSTVELREMTAKEEDILYNKSFIEKGVVMDRLLGSVMVDKRIDPRSLLVIDKNALLLAVRIAGYGSDYPSKIQCSECASTFEANIDLSTLMKIKDAEYSENTKELANGNIEITLPTTKWRVEVKPLTSGDGERLQKTLDSRRRNKLEEFTIIESAKTFIQSINGSVDNNEIYQALSNMPAKDSRFLRNTYAVCFPNITTSVDVTCSVCDSEVQTEVAFGANFFWSK